MPFAQFRRTKAYDLLAAAPLMVWYGLGVYGQIPTLLQENVTAQMTAENIRAVLHVLAMLTTFAFLALLIVLLALRSVPVARADGIAPRAIASAHAFLGVAYLWIAPAHPSLAANIASWLLSSCGTGAAIYVAFWLGRGFSILPEARRLVMQGPYARIRHPLYLAEAIGSLGAVLQFREPWSGLLFLVLQGLLVLRMQYEERVLEKAFPEYCDYRQRTSRLIPGLY